MFGALSYWSITGFAHHRDDNVQRVLGHVLLAAVTLLLVPLFGGADRPRVPPRLQGWMLAAAASALLSTLLAPRSPMAWDRLQLYYTMALWGLAVYLLHRDDQRAAAAPYLLAMALVHAVVLIEVVFWMFQVQGGETSFARRMPYHANVRHFGYLGYLAAASAASLCLLWRGPSLSWLLLCAAALFGIVQLGSRGALLGWLVFLAIGAMLSRQRVRLLVVGLGATLLAVGATWALAEWHLLGNDSLVSRAQQGGLTGATGRLQLWSDVVRAIAERPVFGYGPDGHRVLDCCGTYGPYIAKTSQPHNVVLQLLEEFGLAGTLLLAALGVQMARLQAGGAWLARARERADLAALMAMLGGGVAFGLVDGPFYYPVPLMMLTAVAALSMAAGRSLGSGARP